MRRAAAVLLAGVAGVSVMAHPQGPRVPPRRRSDPRRRRRRRELFDRLSNLTDAASDMREVITAAARSNVSIIAIDPRGLPGTPAPMINPVTTLADDDEAKAVIARRPANAAHRASRPIPITIAVLSPPRNRAGSASSRHRAGGKDREGKD
jgi:hypothetical protein